MPVTRQPANGSSKDAGPQQRTYGDITVVRRERARSDAPNVLFLAIDDCNNWPGFLRNHPGTHTPNLDALAQESINFTKAYCTAPICKVARNGVLFGRHPYEVGVYDHYEQSSANHKILMKNASSLIDDFWAAGYNTLGAGKVFHDGQSKRWTEYRRTPFYVDGVERTRTDLPPGRFDESWLSPYDGKPIGKGENFTSRMLDFGPSGRTPERDPDGQSGIWIREQLAATWRKPFFLAYGLISTHVPWRIPQQFFDLHPIDGIVVPEVRPDELAGIPNYARTSIVDIMHAFELVQESGVWELAVQAYQAAMSYMDYQIGTVLDALAASPYADNTIVAVWSDHGFHLGEKMHLHKFTLWEQATHVPMLLKVPGKFDTGQVFDRPVSTIDLGPTLAKLCGVKIHGPHSGKSMLPMLAKPELADKRPPITTWQESNHAVRSGPWRYIRYRTGETELYNHTTDPDERVNLANQRQHRMLQLRLERHLPPWGPKHATTLDIASAAARHTIKRAVKKVVG